MDSGWCHRDEDDELLVQVRHLISALNEATDAIPGWDEYAKSGRAGKLWDGAV